MAGTILMKANARGGFLGSNHHELVLLDDGIETQKIERGKAVKTLIRYERLIQVRLIARMFSVDLELVGRSGPDGTLVQGLRKGEAEKAKGLIERLIRSAARRSPAGRLAAVQLESERGMEELQSRIAVIETEFQGSREDLLMKIDGLAEQLRDLELLMAATTIYASKQDRGSGIRGCVDAAEEILDEIHRRKVFRPARRSAQAGD